VFFYFAKQVFWCLLISDCAQNLKGQRRNGMLKTLGRIVISLIFLAGTIGGIGFVINGVTLLGGSMVTDGMIDLLFGLMLAILGTAFLIDIHRKNG
jgi:hypothetical protein